MAPTPVLAGFLTGALNPAAADWVHARLMGFDPCKIPLVREAFAAFKYPLTTFEPSAVCVRMVDRQCQAHAVSPFGARTFLSPKGWRGHCELDLQK